MSKGDSGGGGGIGFMGALTILFIGLKLGGVIDWGWEWVLAPIWAPLALALCAFFAVVLARAFR